MRFSPIKALGLAFGIAAISSVSLPAFAHDDWVMPDRFLYKTTVKHKPPFTLSYDFIASDRYFQTDLNRLNYDTGGFDFGVLSPAGNRMEPNFVTMGKTKGFGETLASEPGTYTLFFTRGETPLYYSGFNDGSYRKVPMDELTAKEKANLKETKGYFHSGKTYVVVEKASDAWRTPLGHKLEIVPVDDPTAIDVKKPYKLQVLWQGKPLAEAELELFYDGYKPAKYGDAYTSFKADTDGKAAVIFDRPGRWLVAITHYEPSPDATKAKRYKYYASMMVEAGEHALDLDE